MNRDQMIDVLATLIDREVSRQIVIPYGEFDAKPIAELVLVELAKNKAMQALIPTDPVLVINVPMHMTCTCPPDQRLIKHSFGRGTRCEMCGLPA